VPGAAGTWRDLTDNVNQLAGNLTTQVRAIGDVATAVTKGDLTRSITVDAMGEVAALKDNINEMIRNLRETTQKTTEQDWLKTNLAKFTRMLQGQRDLVTVARQILSELAPLVNAQHGVFYIAEKEKGEKDQDGEVVLKLLASYAYTERKYVAHRFKLGDGLIGQCAFEKAKIHLTNVPTDYVRISSGLGDAPPMSIIVLPVLFEGQVNAVIELASFERLSEIHQVFLDQLTESIGIVVNTIAAGMRTETLLKQSQSLTQELQSQQEELRETNERLEKQAATLRESEERLRQQQEELQLTNEKLEDKAKLLEVKNREVEFAKSELEEKAEQLALTSKYKSEFLANMSHELRTPLNSLLILSKMLSDNADGNLSSKQVEFARTIHGSGADLLSLINDILDLSKIESGTITVDPNEVSFVDLRDYVEQNFRHVAGQKGLEFSIDLDAKLPRSINTDAKRLQQVVKNLLSNAFKFTEHGSVKLSYRVATEGWSRDNQSLARAESVLAFTVSDTGIGIPQDKQKIIFEAFQQADGTTSRKYGGTGLGLSISREIARLLGGEIKVVSTPGQGSTFTLFLPREHVAPMPVPHTERRIEVFDLSHLATAAAAGGVRDLMTMQQPEPLPLIAIADDRENLQPGDRSLLIIEDDTAFAQILLDCARENGFKGIVSSFGDTGLGLVKKLRPSAITLDLRLPDIDGWTVLDRLKHDVHTRHVPVEIISAAEDRHRARKMGAYGVLEKPASRDDIVQSLKRLASFVERPVKKLLLVEDDARERASLVELVGSSGVDTVAVGTGQEALAALESDEFRCMVLDLGLPDMNGFDLLQRIKKNKAWHDLPIIVYTGRDLSKREETQLKRLSETIILKDVKSPERLLDETALYLHRSESELTDPQKKMISLLHEGVPELAGRKILVVDDDIRNIFALTAALERYNVTVQYAENGRDGLDLLGKTPDVDVVLMDIMMPELDGYEVMRRIRQKEEWKELPIIALTAKAMRSDRDKCIQAGASDYISKPVEMDKLLSMLRVWLSN
jgi:signal transduction histidine kinase/DNA-binding response OmpR family regulator/HAMP domain-containing protein